MLKSVLGVFMASILKGVLLVRHLVNVVAGKTLYSKQLEASLQTNASIELLVDQYRISGSAPLGILKQLI